MIYDKEVAASLYSKDRLSHVDSIRGIAATLVLIAHFVAVPAMKSALPQFARFVEISDFGRIGVVIFFFVSGYVIPFSLKRGQNVIGFGVKRFFRLYPAYWTSLLFAVLASGYLLHQHYSTRQTLANMTMLQNFMHIENVLGVYWTLKIELGFYIISAVVFIFGLLESALFMLFLALIFFGVFIIYLDYWTGAFHFGETVFSYLHLLHSSNLTQVADQGGGHPIPGLLNMNWGNFCGYFSVMFLGTALRLCSEGKAKKYEKNLAFIFCFFWVLSLSIAGVIVYLRSYDAGLFSMYGSWVVAFLIFLVLAFVVKLNFRFLVWTGVVSYSLYLFHPLVIDALFSSTYLAGILEDWPIFGLVFCFAASAFIAEVSFKSIEQPSIDLGHALARRFRGAHAKNPKES